MDPHGSPWAMAIGSPSLTACEVPKAIKEAAFENSACPVIITLENYLSPDGQRLGTGDMEGWWQKGKGIRKDAGGVSRQKKHEERSNEYEFVGTYGTSWYFQSWCLIICFIVFPCCTAILGVYPIFLDYIRPMEAQQWFYCTHHIGQRKQRMAVSED